MTKLTQVRAREVVEAVIAAWAAIPIRELVMVLEHRGADQQMSRIARDALLRPLVSQCLEHRKELRQIQLQVLSRDELKAHSHVAHPSLQARFQADHWGGVWADLVRAPRDLLSGYLLALVGLGFTQGVEVHAFTEDIPELLVQLRTRLGKLPPHDLSNLGEPSGFVVSAALHRCWRTVSDMPKSLKDRLRNLSLKGPCTYEDLASRADPEAIKAVRNDFVHLRRLELAMESPGGRSGRWKRFEATAVGLEAVALLTQKCHRVR